MIAWLLQVRVRGSRIQPEQTLFVEGQPAGDRSLTGQRRFASNRGIDGLRFPIVVPQEPRAPHIVSLIQGPDAVAALQPELGGGRPRAGEVGDQPIAVPDLGLGQQAAHLAVGLLQLLYAGPRQGREHSPVLVGSAPGQKQTPAARIAQSQIAVDLRVGRQEVRADGMPARDEVLVPRAVDMADRVWSVPLGEGLVPAGHLVQTLAGKCHLRHGLTELLVKRQVAFDAAEPVDAAVRVVEKAQRLVQVDGIEIVLVVCGYQPSSQIVAPFAACGIDVGELDGRFLIDQVLLTRRNPPQEFLGEGVPHMPLFETLVGLVFGIAAEIVHVRHHAISQSVCVADEVLEPLVPRVVGIVLVISITAPAGYVEQCGRRSDVHFQLVEQFRVHPRDDDEADLTHPLRLLCFEGRQRECLPRPISITLGRHPPVAFEEGQSPLGRLHRRQVFEGGMVV